MSLEHVVIGGVEYVRRKINGYNILHPVSDGIIDYDNYVYEHRLVYELANNVKLNRRQHVHHLNHVRDDNRPENLIAMTSSMHATVHASERGYHTGINHCVDCGKPLFSWKAARCPRCAHMRSRVSTHPTKEQLSEMILTMSNSEIARKLDVSDSAVRKWRKKYGLPSASEQHGWSIGVRKSAK